MKYLIVGLGNIGTEYAATRHNIGFDVVDAFAKKHGAIFTVDRLAEIGIVKLKGKTVILIKPTTYMNLSGRSLKYWMDKENVPIENTLTIVDDLALPLEKLRLKPSGSDAGHNGLKNIQEVLGTTEYPKLRFGIGNNYAKGKQVDFVLGQWTKDEFPLVQQKIDACTDIIERWIFSGIGLTMTHVNGLKFS